MKAAERRERFVQKKSLGQVFLREDWPCRKMVEQLHRLGIQQVLEIGPGPGILTRTLLSAGINVLAVEKDDRLVERLKEMAQSESFTGQLTIVNQDILKFDLDSWLQEQSGLKAICGNIPYNISSPILLWLLPQIARIKIALLMVQWEFGQRLTSPPSAKSYGSLSVFAQLRAKLRLECKVPASCFYPVPKVDSAIVSLTSLGQKEPDEILKKVEAISRKAFSQRRKKLSNSLEPFLKEGSEAFPIDLSRRCETLSPAEFIALAKALDPS